VLRRKVFVWNVGTKLRFGRHAQGRAVYNQLVFGHYVCVYVTVRDNAVFGRAAYKLGRYAELLEPVHYSTRGTACPEYKGFLVCVAQQRAQ